MTHLIVSCEGLHDGRPNTFKKEKVNRVEISRSKTSWVLLMSKLFLVFRIPTVAHDAPDRIV